MDESGQSPKAELLDKVMAIYMTRVQKQDEKEAAAKEELPIEADCENKNYNAHEQQEKTQQEGQQSIPKSNFVNSRAMLCPQAPGFYQTPQKESLPLTASQPPKRPIHLSLKLPIGPMPTPIVEAET